MNVQIGMASADLRLDAEALAAAGGRAPSLHNAQPWSFRVERDHVDVLLDRSRLLPVADPANRQAHLGLGAAVFLLRLKLATMDRAAEVLLGPDPTAPDVVARITAGGWRTATDEDRWLFAALPARRTVRTPFTAGVVPVPLQVDWRSLAEDEGADLRWVEAEGERIGVAALVAAAERLQQRDPAYLAELDRWTSPDRVEKGAGVPPSAFGVTAAAGHVAEFPLRDFAGGTPYGPAAGRRTAGGAPGAGRAAHPGGPARGLAARRPGADAGPAGRRGRRVRRVLRQPAARAARPAPAAAGRAAAGGLAAAGPPARPARGGAAPAGPAPAAAGAAGPAARHLTRPGGYDDGSGVIPAPVVVGHRQ